MSLGFNPEIALLEYLVKGGCVGGELIAKGNSLSPMRGKGLFIMRHLLREML